MLWPLVGFALLVCLRMPEIIIKGRFWAEEGRIFFHNAWTQTPGAALLTSYGGYLNLAANASTLAAFRFMPLEFAPYVTIAAALLVQLCPPLLLLTARDGWLRSGPVRLFGVALILLIPASEEIWLQTLHCQFELALCCGIILALDTAVRGPTAALRLALLFLAPLCGPIAISLLALFLIRAAFDRSPARLLQVAALSAGASVQLLWFFHAVAGRGYHLDPVIFLCVLFIRHLEVPFLGTIHAARVADLVRWRLSTGHIPVRATLLPVLMFGALLLAAIRQPPPRPALWLLAAGGVVAAAAYFGAIGGASALIDARLGERYVFVPQGLFALVFLALAATSKRWIAGVSWVAVFWLTIMGAVAFSHPWPLVSDGPAWRQEVALWHQDPAHPLKLWPEGWVVNLNPRPR